MVVPHATKSSARITIGTCQLASSHSPPVLDEDKARERRFARNLIKCVDSIPGTVTYVVPGFDNCSIAITRHEDEALARWERLIIFKSSVLSAPT